MRKVFFSFDWDDVWRANQVRNSWVTQGGDAEFFDKAEIETVKKSTKTEIKKWIAKQMDGTSVTCVLIGKETYKSEWVQYEIEQSIEKGNGLLGIYIDKLKDMGGNVTTRGKKPFSPHYKTYDYKTYDWEKNYGYENLDILGSYQHRAY